MGATKDKYEEYFTLKPKGRCGVYNVVKGNSEKPLVEIQKCLYYNNADIYNNPKMKKAIKDANLVAFYYFHKPYSDKAQKKSNDAIEKVKLTAKKLGITSYSNKEENVIVM